MNPKKELLKFISEIDDGIFLIDEDNEFTFFNAGWLELIEYSATEIQNKTLLDILHPQDKKSFLEIIQSLVDKQEVDLIIHQTIHHHLVCHRYTIVCQNTKSISWMDIVLK